MSDRKPNVILSVAVILAVLLAGYVLSIGPATRFCLNTPGRERVYSVVYSPLNWLRDQSSGAKVLLDAYQSWWLR